MVPQEPHCSVNNWPAGDTFSVVLWWTHDRDDTPPIIRRRLAAELIAVSWSFYVVVRDAMEAVVSNLPGILEIADLRQIHIKLYAFTSIKHMSMDASPDKHGFC